MSGGGPVPPLGRALPRAASALRRLLGSRRIDFVYSPAYSVDLGGVPFDPHRGERVLTFLLSERLIRWSQVLRPEPASLGQLLAIHTEAYLRTLHTADGFIPIVGYPVPDEHRERALASQRAQVGGTILAARRARSGKRTAVNLGGGLHHARPDGGGGFCAFNDVAVAIANLRGSGHDERILVVDLDLHDGNGTRAAFAEDASVFTFSVHNRHWDRAPATAARSLELEGEVDDARYLETLRAELPPVLDEFRPQMAFYLAGTDLAADDGLGNWALSADGLLARDRFVVESLEDRSGPPLVVTLSGGYGSETWRYSARFLAWLVTRRRIEPPSTEAVTLLGYRERIRRLDPVRLEQAAPEADWSLTESDVYGGLGASARKTRFLGHYSLHAIELVLETSGLLDRLRAMGFAHPSLAMDLENPAGETLRLFSASDRSELLMELRVRRDRRSLTDSELLRLEWLLLQNPRATFGERQPLPGQRHPGLGLLRDVMSLLLLMCEHLELDGILFVPSHFHLASKGRRFLRFIDPEDEGWLRAVRRAVADLPLADATRAVARGEVVDAATGEPVGWRPMPMVVPVSDGLRERFRGDAYERTAVAAERRREFRLAAAP